MEFGKNRFFGICEAYQSVLGKKSTIGMDARRYRMVNESLDSHINEGVRANGTIDYVSREEYTTKEMANGVIRLSLLMCEAAQNGHMTIDENHRFIDDDGNEVITTALTNGGGLAYKERTIFIGLANDDISQIEPDRFRYIGMEIDNNFGTIIDALRNKVIRDSMDNLSLTEGVKFTLNGGYYILMDISPKFFDGLRSWDIECAGLGKYDRDNRRKDSVYFAKNLHKPNLPESVQHNSSKGRRVDEGAGAGYTVHIKGLKFGKILDTEYVSTNDSYGGYFKVRVSVVPGEYEIDAEDYYNDFFWQEHEYGDTATAMIKGGVATFESDWANDDEESREALNDEFENIELDVSFDYSAGWIHSDLSSEIDADRVNVENNSVYFTITNLKLDAPDLADAVNAGYRSTFERGEDGEQDDELEEGHPRFKVGDLVSWRDPEYPDELSKGWRVVDVPENDGVYDPDAIYVIVNDETGSEAEVLEDELFPADIVSGGAMENELKKGDDEDSEVVGESFGSYAGARSATTEVIDMCENGAMDWESVARECMQYMSEDDVRDMAESNDWIEVDASRGKPRGATVELIDLAENGSLSWEDIARECMEYMSEDDVRDMAESNDWIEVEDDEETDEESDEESDEDNSTTNWEPILANIHDGDIVDCCVKFKDDGSEEDVSIKVSTDVGDDDDEIFYYCDGVDDFRNLLTGGGNEDFEIVEVY